MQLKKQILKIIKKSSYSPAGIEEIIKFVGPLEGANPKNISKALKQLVEEGKVKIDKQGNYYAPKESEVTGNFEANKKGFGFVVTDDFDVYIKSNNVGSAMHGDVVRAQITKRKKGFSFEGRITGVITRAYKTIVGQLELRDGCQLVFPSDQRLNFQFEVEKPVEFKKGLIVEARITQFPKKGTGKCIITEVIGNEDDPGVEVEVIIREHGLRTEFPEEAKDEAAGAPSEVREEDLKGRTDYRQDYVVTIDGLDAKDFDDAIQINHENGLYNLTIHIADVSHYVEPVSALDHEASLRSFSTYLTDRVIPMLPEALSNNICSLNPKVDRLTMSAEMSIDKRGEVKSFSVNKGVINSKARLTYSQVDKSLATGVFENEQQKQTLTLAARLSDVLEEKRLRQGSVNFETIEPKIIIDKNHNPVNIEIREKTPATKLIEEAMVLTNEEVAKFIKSKNLPLIRRIHEDPAEDAFEEVRLLLGQMGYPSKKMAKATAEGFQNILKFAHQRKDKLIINNVLLRLMKKARYSTLEAGHFGLALKHYAHFTSPIRRYPDLLVHRQVKAVLEGKKTINEDIFSEAAKEATLRQAESDAAERESDTVYICKLMKDKVGSVYEGVVSGVTNFGIFVQLPNSAEGLVHISNLKGDYFRFEPERFVLRGVRTGQVYRLGQTVKVKLIQVIVGERQIDLIPVKG